jgi:beta-ketoacyl ACP synthase
MAEFSTGNGLPDVVVTGVAMTTALATDADGTWKRLLDGHTGIRRLEDEFIEQFDLPVRIGGHLLDDPNTAAPVAISAENVDGGRPASVG